MMRLVWCVVRLVILNRVSNRHEETLYCLYHFLASASFLSSSSSSSVVVAAGTKLKLHYARHSSLIDGRFYYSMMAMMLLLLRLSMMMMMRGVTMLQSDSMTAWLLSLLGYYKYTYLVRFVLLIVCVNDVKE